MNKCKCKICGKEFSYDGKESPMLNNETWKTIVEHYDLVEYENKAFDLYRKTNFGFRKNFKDDDKYHLYICSNCMEKALGRKLLKSDLIGENVPFNQNFEKNYFQ